MALKFTRVFKAQILPQLCSAKLPGEMKRAGKCDRKMYGACLQHVAKAVLQMETYRRARHTGCSCNINLTDSFTTQHPKAVHYSLCKTLSTFRSNMHEQQ